jgi:OFA family oxalate/formate antiporter-like MFS transporter
MKYSGDFPFSVKKSPFYYGWVILFAGSLGVLFSIPGQTMGVSVYTDFLITNLGLDRVQISSAYLIGTLISSLLMTRAGLFFDRFGARIAASTSALFLGLVLIYLSFSVQITNFLTGITGLSQTIMAFIVMVIGFLGIRFFGQGMLTLVSRGMVMRWFEQHRGFAAAIHGIFVSFGFSYAPRVLSWLIEISDWRSSWFILGTALIAGVLPVIVIVFRDSPESCGMDVEEGLGLNRKSKSSQKIQKSLSLEEARRDPQLWFYMTILFFWALFGTAFTFHVTSIFNSLGKTSAEAVAIFLPIAIISVITSFTGNWLSDLMRMKNFFYLFILGSFIASASLAFPFDSTLFIILGMGIAGGLFSIITTITWPKLYGREHLGAISGLAMTFMVAGSALGPWAFSLIENTWKNYRFAGILGMIFVSILFIASVPIMFRSKD